MLSFRHYLAGLLGLSLLAVIVYRSVEDDAPPPAGSRPKLAVLVVFDQLRADYLTRWERLFGQGGFSRLCKDGAWFQECYYPYATTMTGPGHASLATGTTPDTHGIVLNDWYDRATGKEVNCVATTRYEQIPPPIPEKGKKPKNEAASPDLLLVPTFADALKAATGGKARVVSLSLKDRAAVLPAGGKSERKPDACYWMDKNGQFVTSTYYRDTPHPWVSEFNRSGYVDRWRGTTWERLRDDLDYVSWSGPDDVKGERTGLVSGFRFTRTFPHALDGGQENSTAAYHTALTTSPFGNDVLLELARRAIDAEKLGQEKDRTDFLSLSFSSNDLVGHAWGPDSQEVLDITLRSDQIVRDLLDYLDRKVGKGRYVLVLTADHGVCPLPEVSKTKGKDAVRVDPKQLLSRAEEYLDQAFPEGGLREEAARTLEGFRGPSISADSPGAPPPARPSSSPRPWIEAVSVPNIYLNRGKIEQRKLRLADVASSLAGWLEGQSGIQTAYTEAQLAQPAATGDPYGQPVRKSYRAGRSGDVVLVEQRYCLVTSYPTGTTHGTPHDYDTHVPLLVYGAGVNARKRRDLVTPQHGAVILARSVGIDPPPAARARLPEGLLR